MGFWSEFYSNEVFWSEFYTNQGFWSEWEKFFFFFLLCKEYVIWRIRKIIITPPTQGIWCSNDDISAVRLMECKIVGFHSVSNSARYRYYGSHDYGTVELVTDIYHMILILRYKLFFPKLNYYDKAIVRWNTYTPVIVI